MSDRNRQQHLSQESATTRFMKGAGQVNDPDNKLWGPAKWLVGMIQYLVAVMMVTIAEGFKAILSGKKPQGRRRPHGQ
ncbi:uncharacterized protein RCC_03332 [Ramularia collo-cygni]|uniref:Uncharacterized protein n=1 Tax=Ramularia collo-cygni TaxID=112498 RepID=A0A2D3US26_9PEZI|nr:uncharacterized protein RCC_03332 [Ramularia collo-cygni]CZT17498.1 uncharacterized protein RCC_03332 [Ramularia collo-cygni]